MKQCITAVLPSLLGAGVIGSQSHLSAQVDSARVSVSGVVGDARTGRPIANAVVAIPQLNVRTLTDSAGRFFLAEVPAAQHEWLFRALGYADWLEEMNVSAGEYLRIGLLPQPIALENILVTADRLAARRKAAGLSVMVLSWEDLQSTSGTHVADVIVQRSVHPPVSCPSPVTGIPRREPANPHPARSAPRRERPPLGGASAVTGVCFRWRGKVISPTIYLDDELIPVPIDMLYSYSPHEIHSIEYYQHPAAGMMIRVYTLEFVKSGKPLQSTGALFR